MIFDIILIVKREDLLKKTISFILILIFILPFLTSCQSSFFEVSASTDQFVPAGVSAGNCEYGGEIKAIQAIDRYTVRFDLCEPDPAFPAKVAFPVFAIQDENLMNFSEGNSGLLGQSANGTGPYYVKEYKKGEYISLARREDYWGVPPKTKEIRFEWINDDARRRVNFHLGRGDGIDQYLESTSQNELVEEKYEVFYRPSLDLMFLGMNNTIKPFDNQQFREAVAYAINQKQIVETFYPIGSEVANQVTHISMQPGYTKGLDWYETNLQAATNALEASQIDPEEEIILYYSEENVSYITNPGLVAQEIVLELRSVGLNIRSKQLPETEYNTLVANGGAGLFLYGVSVDYPDASRFYKFLFSENKFLGNPYLEINTAVQNASNTANDRERQKFYDEANNLIKQQVPFVPIAHASSSLAFQNDIQNVLVGPMNENFTEMISHNLPLVFLQENEPTILWPADETDTDTFRITSLIYDTLVQYEYGSTGLRPGLADSWETNEDLTTWTFKLRYGVKFLNGADFDANDVVSSFSAIWDLNNPNHHGNTGEFKYFKKFFGVFLNRE